MNTTVDVRRDKKGVLTAQGTLDAIDFKSQSSPVYDHRGVEVEGYQRIWRPDTGRTLAIMTDSYRLVEHREVMAPAIEALGREGWQIGSSHVERHGASAFVQLERRDKAIKVVGEKVGERIFMRNTYDGTSTLQLTIGAIVLVCSNGAVIPGKGSIGFNSHHTGDIRERLHLLTAKVRKIEEGLGQRMIESCSQLDAPVPTEIGKEIIKRVLGERHTPMALNHWTQGIGRDGSRSAWNLYNGVTQFLTHDYTGGWGRRERKNSQAFDLIAHYIQKGSLPEQEEAEQN